MKKEVIVFKKTITANTPVYLTERIKDNGVIEELRVRFYPGVERGLQVMPYISHKIKAREDLISYNESSDQYITGDNDYFIYPVNVEVEYDDDLVIFANNVSNYDFTLSVDVIVSYDGGQY